MKSRKASDMAIMRCLAAAVLLAMLISMVGCNTTGCMENRNSVPLAGFYSSSTGTQISLDSVQVIGEGMPEDDPLSAAGTRISTLYLPMRSTQSSTTWIFQYKWKRLDYPQLYDTISFRYESTPYFASSDCGVIYKYLITDMTYTTHLMDSVVLVDSLITNVDVERIKIFMRTADEEESSEDNDTGEESSENAEEDSEQGNETEEGGDSNE